MPISFKIITSKGSCVLLYQVHKSCDKAPNSTTPPKRLTVTPCLHALK